MPGRTVPRVCLAGLALGLLVLGGCGTAPGSPSSTVRASPTSRSGFPAESGPPTTSNSGAAWTPPTSSRAPTPSATPLASVPEFWATISSLTADDLAASWRPGCPVPVADLRAVEVTHWDFTGAVRTGRLVVAADQANAVVQIMRDVYRARLPIERMEPVEAFGGSDDASMAANNTSAFNCRATTGGSSWSEHAYGRAIDVNPEVNPYVRGRLVLPPAGVAHLDRSRRTPGMIHAGDAVVRAFATRGWAWGGTWTSLKDYQHFSTTGR